jgi:type III secretion protein D
VNAPFPVTATDERVLRVLSGRLRGAEHRLHAGKFIRIGHSFNNDVVLRGTGTSGTAAELRLFDDHATLHVVSGEIKLLGRTITANEDTHLPFFVPFAVGEFSAAIGSHASDRWDEVERLITTTAVAKGDDEPGEEAPLPVAQPATAMERAVTRLYPMRDWIDVKRHLPKIGLGIGLALLLMVAVGPVYNWADDAFRGPGQAEATLTASGFKGLTVARDQESSALIISGVLRTDKELAKLRTLASTSMPGAIVEVETTESHAAAVSEILTAQGIKGVAAATGVGVVLIKSEFLPKDKQSQIVQMLKQDISSIKSVKFSENTDLGNRDLQYFFSSSDYGIATYVDGNPSYIVTADGTRWFPGAVVPTGHEIVAMGNNRVTFQREGKIDELVL